MRAFTLDAVEETGPDGVSRMIGRAGIRPPIIEMAYEEVSMGQAVVTGYRPYLRARTANDALGLVALN